MGTLTFAAANLFHGESYGGEAVLTVTANESWRLTASYSLLLMHAHGEPAGDAAEFGSNAPTHQAVLRSAYDFTRHASLDAQFRYVDSVLVVPAYITADLRWSYRPTANLELSLLGQNLLDRHHPAQDSTIGAPTIEVPRGFSARILWRF